MKTVRTIRGAFAVVIAAALCAGAITAANAAETIQVMRHATPALPGYGVLMLEVWTDGSAVQVIGLDGEGRIVLAREGTVTETPTLEGTGGSQGVLPADELEWIVGAGLAYRPCTKASCAEAIATRAESLVRASEMGATEGAGDDSIMAKLCPAQEADGAGAHAPTEAIAALAVEAPCKWVPVPLEELAPMPGVGRQTLVLIGSTVHQLRQARWAIWPDPS